MDFLGLRDKTILVFGIANRRSVACAVGRLLAEAGARILYAVRDSGIERSVRPLVGDAPILICNVECEEDVAGLAAAVAAYGAPIHGLVHSIAFANYSQGFCAFHETTKRDFLQAVDISCFSLVALVNSIKPLLAPDASIVTVSISTTRMASESYGYMGPVKAALDSTVVFLAKSLSPGTRIRVNAVGAGLLKTSASAGIPGYVDAYLYAEQVIPRKKPLATEEVANAIVFLLSSRASGITGQTLVVDAGMAMNYFDRDVVRRVVGGTVPQKD